MSDIFLIHLSLFADTSSAVAVVRDWVTPTVRLFAALAGIACTFFIVNSGYMYMTSSGRPEQMEHAKHVLKSALIGMVIVLAAVTLTSILANAYGHNTATQQSSLPSLQAIPPNSVSNGLVDILIKAVTGFLNNIIQAVASPFLAALDFFTKETPLMADNQSVFNLWLGMVAIANALFVVILALIGLHVMSAASFGFDEIEFKHMLPRVGLIFLLMNTSLFMIDGIIELSNVLIQAVGKLSGSSSVWQTLTSVVKESGGQGVAALLMMMAFLIFTVILLVYYVGRLVTLFIGAVLSPLVVLLWLVPGFRDFSETAAKTYLSTIFVLFVHVVILQLAASLFTGMSAANSNQAPDTLLAMIVGLATVLALLRTQGVMMQFSYVSLGSRNARKLGGQFMNGVSYMSKGSKAALGTAGSAAGDGMKRMRGQSSGGTITLKQPNNSVASSSNTQTSTRRSSPQQQANAKQPTGKTYEASEPTSRSAAVEDMKTKVNTKKGSKS